MAGIRDIRAILDQYPEIKYKSTDLDISIPRNKNKGYDIYLTVHAEGITLYCDGWHREYETIEKVWPDLVKTLTPDWRFRVIQRGKSRYNWAQEVFNGEKWKTGWVVGLMFYPFWRKAETLVLQNDYFTDSADIEKLIKSLDEK